MLRRNVKIVSTGLGLPDTVLHDHELDARLGLPAGETYDFTGVRQRYQSTTETSSLLAARACRAALAQSPFDWNDIDCLVATSATMDKALPYNAAMIHAELGLHEKRTMTLDIGSSCMSFLTGLDLISTAIAFGRFRTAMIVAADISTFTVDYGNLRENGIFGDGAAAAILTADETSSSIIISRSITLSEGVDYCHINAGGSRYHRRVPHSNADAVFGMNGPAMLDLAARQLPAFVESLLSDAGMTMSDIDLVIPHQASKLALDRLSRRLKVSRDRYVDVFERYGNQVAASLPTALHTAIEEKRIQRGQTAMLVGSGAGITIGGMIFVY
ncbi:MAG: 3-oxoacyl-ACP synthase [Leptonema illini]|uniref:3-oxoacyl-ACP synthase n=1 Tax=Leptonema illini TaxID=183 RepID=A0A833LXK5_9LEPT|nr:MAG: 3-oxoacyl-ACP synthase [Leptonema illini]